jgi:hypothetical protein
MLPEDECRIRDDLANLPLYFLAHLRVLRLEIKKWNFDNTAHGIFRTPLRLNAGRSAVAHLSKNAAWEEVSSVLVTIL